MKENRLKQLEDGGFDDAAEFIRNILSSPYYDGYLAVKCTIYNLNSELKNGAAKIIVEDDNGSEKAFDKSHKYITEMIPYYEQLEYFREKMLPNEIKKAEQEVGTLLDQARNGLKKRNEV